MVGRDKPEVGRGINVPNERGKRLPLLGLSSGNGREQSPLLAVLQSIAGSQLG